MKFQSRRICRQLSLFLFSAFLFSTSGCQSKYPDLGLGMYLYRDTRDLVRFVYDASLVLQNEGIQGIDQFKDNLTKYTTPDYYLYIYSLDGTNLFHGGMPELEGKNLLDVTDKNGKQITKLILRAIENPNNRHGWVHYTWWEPGKFYPVPKSSCHFKVTSIDGKDFFIGGGIDYPHEEKEFIRIIVDDAVERINREGASAISSIADPFSEYNYRDVRVFVFHADGTALISPVVNKQFQKRNIVDCVDEAGHRPFEKALKRLNEKEATWEVFLAKSRYQRGLIKKSLYLRKAFLDGKLVYVGAVTDLPQPP
ncbi:calcium:proton antiporter [Prosthecochloris marina]|uniref:Calcium:proton antiporter n=1 Tax=Prosthecochloris marina TaxID=2017681 RepID=A0A317T9M6_9CHLB|nr:cache domain-containing protein [Prosthecochloris marina]PWW83138.1 calcium:proton antiporter [Prosthecochloris marina]